MLHRQRLPTIDEQPREPASGFEHLPGSAIALLSWLGAGHLEYVLVGQVGEAIRGIERAQGPVAVVPAPYGRNVERLCRLLDAAHAQIRVDGRAETRPVRMTEDKLLRGGRWTLRCGTYDLDIEGAPSGAPRYQELVYEAARFQPAPGLSVEVASPEDLAYYAHLAVTGSPPEITIRRAPEVPGGQATQPPDVSQGESAERRQHSA